MKRLILLFLLPLAFALSACQSLPPEVTVAGCGVAPLLVPDAAAEINAACATYAYNMAVGAPSP